MEERISGKTTSTTCPTFIAGDFYEKDTREMYLLRSPPVEEVCESVFFHPIWIKT